MSNLSFLPSINNCTDILGNEILNQEVSEEAYKSRVIETIPVEYRKSKFSDLPVNLKDIICGKTDKKGFFITGPAGTGKTFAAWGIYKYLNFIEESCYLVDFDTLIDSIQDSKFGKKSMFSLEEVEKYPGYLIIDDFGTKGETAFTNSIIRRIISKRADWHRKTGFTSNLSEKEISDKFDDRIASRILGYYEIVRFDGKDIRLETTPECRQKRLKSA